MKLTPSIATRVSTHHTSALQWCVPAGSHEFKGAEREFPVIVSRPPRSPDATGRRHLGVYIRCAIAVAMVMSLGQLDFARQTSSTTPTLSPATGMVIVSVVGPDGNPLSGAFNVKMVRAGTMFTDHYQTTDSTGLTEFTQVQFATYDIIASAAGYKPGAASVDVSAIRSTQTVSVVLERTADNPETPPDEKGLTLAPDAKKEASAGISEMRAGHYDQAEQHLNAAYKLAPGDPNVNVMLGELYVTTKNYEKAQDYIAHALSLEPDNAAGQTDMGYLHVQEKDYSAAQTNLQRAVVLAPRNWFAHWLLGLTYLRLNEPAKAQTEAMAAIKVGKSQAADAQYLLGESLALQGRKNEAVKALQRLTKNYPENSNVNSAKALIAKLQSGGQPGLVPPTSAAVSDPNRNRK